MAERNRRGEEAVNSDLDDLLGDDDIDVDEQDDDADDLTDADDLSDADDVTDADSSANGKAKVARSEKAKAAGKADLDDPDKPRSTKKGSKDKGPGLFGRFLRFVREIVAELRKVIWPTRKELLTYTSVVVVFVVIIVAIVSALDYGFAKAMQLIFGGGSSS